MSTRAAFTAFVVSGLAAVTLVVACQGDLPPPAKCSDIPAGGCPRRDDACVDPSCTAVYVCKSDGTWGLDRTCPPRDAGAFDATPPPSDAAASRDVQIDVPGANGGPGCEDLLAPDCALGTALACAQGCCGCEDLYVCQSGGWALWGSCTAGTITPDTRDH